jgi:hypothetical protein
MPNDEDDSDSKSQEGDDIVHEVTDHAPVATKHHPDMDEKE